ncbi:glycosyltransferase family 2 protein [Gemmatimonas sp.]|uniref:glycosyltransferase family 2 protein n=1 Tax=Gemmatimonas sp. TaxID=1962908 RepID=UPI0039836392
MTLVSVVIPTRNRHQFLSETVASVQEQTFLDWELIIVDEASNDETPVYLRSLSDPRIRFTRHAYAQGVAAARNTGLAQAGGELVMFLDDDDLLRSDALDTLRRALADYPDALAASAACRLFRETGDSDRVYRPARAYSRRIWREVLFGWWSNSGQNLYRTAVIRDIGGFDTALRAGEDRMLWLEIARRGNVCLVPTVAMEYRQHPGQFTQSSDWEAERQLIWQRFIHSLPPSLHAEGVAIRRAAALTADAEAARAAGHFYTGARLQCAAFVAAPRLLVSPLVARPMYWNFKKCVQRRRTP